MERRSRRRRSVFGVSVLAIVTLVSQVGTTQVVYEPNAPISAARERAAVIYNRLTGQKAPIDSKIIKDMEVLVAADNEMGAAHLATEQPSFYSQTVRVMGNKMSNRAGTNRAVLNDLSATVIGFTKDEIDFRQILTANYLYRFQNLTPLRVNVVTDILSSNNHYVDVETALATNPNMDIRPNLVQAVQQIATDANAAVNHPDAAGILTSRAFLSDCADAGTNRRCYQKVVNLLTCHTLEEVATSSLPDDRIGKDVSRAPGGDPGAFQVTCKSCHSNMDGQRSAFAFTEFDPAVGRVKHGQVNGGNLFNATTRVANKMNSLGEGNFTVGYTVADDAWINYAVSGEVGDLYGWRDASGNRITQRVVSQGLNSYGAMVGRSEAFSKCMAQTVFENVCRRTPTSNEKAGLIRDVASSWEKPAQGNYKLRWLFERVATSPACTGKI